MIESILVFSRATPRHHIGGMEILSWSLAAELARHVRQVRVVTTAVPGVDGPFTADGVEVVPLAGTRPGRYSAAWWRESRAYWTSLAEPPGAVLSVSAGAYAVARTRARHPGTPFVLQAHGTSMMEISSKLRAGSPRLLATAPKNAAWLLRDLARYRDFDRIVAVGARVVDSLAARPQRWFAPADRVRHIPNGVRPADHAADLRARRELRAAFGIDERVTVVGCVGRLHAQKRLDRVLRAAAVLRDRGHAARFRFLLVGGGPDESRLRGLVRDLRLADLVTFVGQVRPDEVGRYHAAADVALLTTAHLEVGLPMAILEALASGLPCVVSRGIAGPAALDSAVHPVDTDDPGALADILHGMPPVPAPRSSLLPDELTLAHCARSYLALLVELRGRYVAP
ncbi:glycosyltransferase family 4 protein [Plantactinospora sp. ZYX-F-223]|uniref:glycosyltransferase family 4 protein n=1 Tax=Plantactinospora sp. ZYX-F-223 TaxID=3144103 RepID=UPI0031FE3C1C